MTSQHVELYHLKPAREIGITAGGMALWFGSRALLKRADQANQVDINNLNPNKIWAIDRGAIDNNSSSAKTASDLLLYSSFALPLSCYLSHGVDNEGLAMAVMFIEAVIITDVFNTSIKAISKRYRPYAYNENVSLAEKIGGGTRLSFLSGHTSISAAMSFLSAKALTSTNPEGKWNNYIWAAAVTIPAVTGYLRVRAGRHFPTDVLAGYILGAGVGLLIPELHKNENAELIFNGSRVGFSYSLK